MVMDLIGGEWLHVFFFFKCKLSYKRVSHLYVIYLWLSLFNFSIIIILLCLFKNLILYIILCYFI